MTTLFRLRLGCLGAATLCVAALTLWGVQYSWRQIRDLEQKLTSTQFDSYRLAERFQQRLLNLNMAMWRYAVRHEATLWTDFEKASEELNAWIDQYDPRLNPKSIVSTRGERELFQQLNDAYDGYIAASQKVHTNQPPVLSDTRSFTQLDEFDAQAARLLDLGLELARAHRDAENTFLEDANHALDYLRDLLFGGVVVLLGLMGAVGAVIYRDQIAPLRTKLVQSEAVLEKQSKLAALGTLAAGIAHEIRNPLTSVKARLYTLDKHLETPALARKDAQIIGTEISRLERIVQDVLSFARPSEPELKPLSTQALLRDVQSLMAPSLENQRVQLALQPGADAWVSGDAAHLKQVLINLVRNAAEAADGPGHVTLRARTDQARLGGTLREAVILEVIDTGRGIPPEVEKHLFDPFFSTKETGTGLGLSIAARIIEKHGGILQYQTLVGRGTTFGIVLPRQRPPGAPPSAAPA